MLCPICSSKKTCYFTKKNNYTYHRCGNCKTIYLSALPSQKQLHRYYAKQISYHDGLHNEAVIRKRSRIILKKITHIASHAKTLCDVGSSYGYFLDEACKSGYKTIGIEPSSQIAKKAKKMYRIKTFIGELQDYVASEQKQFDIVTCIHVLEHVYNPKVFVSFLFKLIKPGGILYIETPNSDSHLLYTEREHYTFLLPPEHIWLFSKESIKYLLPKNTRTISINTYSYSEHFMGILKKKLLPVLRREESTPQGHIKRLAASEKASLTKHLRYLFFDKLLAPLFTGLLNLYHKGSILELYIKKNISKSGL